VWSVPNNADLKVLDDYLGREVSWWWNYPCNDNDLTKIFPADTYTNFLDETHISNSDQLESGLRLKTLIINPMQQGELSKIALFSVADYAWNMATFDNMGSWQASLPAIVGEERAKSFETLVPHLRYYDELAPLGRLINTYKKAYGTGNELSAATALLAELERIGGECDVIASMADSDNESDRLFYADLRPWLMKLKAMVEHASVMIQALGPDGDTIVDKVTFAKSWSAIEGMEKNENYQFDVLTGMDSDIALSVRTAEPSARLLRPFLDWLLTKHSMPE
jgi:hyaluronoglucosaminidase